MFEHCAQLRQTLLSGKQHISYHAIFYLQTDGRQDHNIAFLRSKLAITAVFVKLGVNHFLVIWGAPHGSWINDMERSMPLLNIGLESVALQQFEMCPWAEEAVSSATNMAKVRAVDEQIRNEEEAILWIRNQHTRTSPLSVAESGSADGATTGIIGHTDNSNIIDTLNISLLGTTPQEALGSDDGATTGAIGCTAEGSISSPSNGIFISDTPGHAANTATVTPAVDMAVAPKVEAPVPRKEEVILPSSPPLFSLDDDFVEEANGIVVGFQNCVLMYINKSPSTSDQRHIVEATNKNIAAVDASKIRFQDIVELVGKHITKHCSKERSQVEPLTEQKHIAWKYLYLQPTLSTADPRFSKHCDRAREMAALHLPSL